MQLDEDIQIKNQLSYSTFFGKSIIISYMNKKYININILDFNNCYGGMLLALNFNIYLCSFSGSTNPNILYIGGISANNPYIPTSTIINKTIKIEAQIQMTHWLCIIYGQVSSTIQSIQAF